MMVEKVKVVDPVPTADIAVDYGTSVGYVNDMSTIDMGVGQEVKEGLSTEIILYIVVGVCAVVGIALGIIIGKRAANK